MKIIIAKFDLMLLRENAYKLEVDGLNGICFDVIEKDTTKEAEGDVTPPATNDM